MTDQSKSADKGPSTISESVLAERTLKNLAIFKKFKYKIKDINDKF